MSRASPANVGAAVGQPKHSCCGCFELHQPFCCPLSEIKLNLKARLVSAYSGRVSLTALVFFPLFTSTFVVQEGKKI